MGPRLELLLALLPRALIASQLNSGFNKRWESGGLNAFERSAFAIVLKDTCLSGSVTGFDDGNKNSVNTLMAKGKEMVEGKIYKSQQTPYFTKISKKQTNKQNTAEKLKLLTL